jgi:hypothetical protein
MNVTMIYDNVYSIVTFLDSLLSVSIVLVGIFIYVRKKNKIGPYFNLLKNYMLRDTIESLNRQLDRLNNYSGDDTDSTVICEIESIMREIVSQVEANDYLHKQVNQSILDDFSKYAADMSLLTEPLKRSVVSGLRENIKNINLKIYIQLIGESFDE